MLPRGARVAGLDVLDGADTARAIGAAGHDFVAIRADLTVPEEVETARAAVGEAWGQADIVVNVAAIMPGADWDDTDYAMFRRVQTTNLDSQFLVCKAFVPGMIAKGWGRVINFTSGVTDLPAPGYIAYRCSKAAVIGLTRGLAADLGTRYPGITANAVSPSLVATPGAVASGGARYQEAITASQIIKRASVPEDIVGLVSFLASEDAAFVTGQTIYADGGFVLR